MKKLAQAGERLAHRPTIGMLLKKPASSGKDVAHQICAEHANNNTGKNISGVMRPHWHT